MWFTVVRIKLEHKFTTKQAHSRSIKVAAVYLGAELVGMQGIESFWSLEMEVLQRIRSEHKHADGEDKYPQYKTFQVSFFIFPTFFDAAKSSVLFDELSVPPVELIALIPIQYW